MMTPQIRCGFHGLHEWEGGVICGECGRMLSVDPHADPGLEPRCACGARATESLRMLCPRCFTNAKKRPRHRRLRPDGSIRARPPTYRRRR